MDLFISFKHFPYSPPIPSMAKNGQVKNSKEEIYYHTFKNYML